MRFSRFSFEWIAVFIIGLGMVFVPEQAKAQRPLGIDVSSYQGSSDNPPTNVIWTSVKSAGISFAWAKATEGTFYIDANFAYNEANAKAAGVLIGAYHFAHPDDDPNLTGSSSADSEAAYFWNEAGPYIVGGGAYLVPALDYETAPTSLTQAQSAAWVNEWCQDIVNYGKANGVVIKPIVYTYTSFATSWLTATNTQWPLWMAASLNGQTAQTGSPPTSPWSTWAFWQYGQGTVSGVEGAVDEDVFNGTSATLLNYVVTGTPAPAGVTLYWDPGAKQASPGSGGTGSWDFSTADWWLSGASNLVWSTGGDNPVFAGTAGTVTLNAALSAGTVTFNTGGYTIGGTANTLTLTSPATISVPLPTTSPVNMNCILSGSGYTVTGGGVLVLNNAANSSVSPISIVSNSTLVIAGSKAIGTGSGTVTVSGGGTLQNNDTTNGDAFLNSAFNILMGTGGGNLNDNINASLTYGGVIGGSGSLTKTGGGGGTGGTLILTGTNTYSGNTLISQGVLALGSTGSINNSPSITIAAGATLDVSAISNWTLSSSAVLKASGTGTTVGSTAATIKGASATGASLGTQPITLIFTPMATNGDVTHPSLYVSQGTLSLSHGNTFTISNATSTALGVGLYTLIQQASGSISGTPYPTPAFSGAGVVSGTTSSLSVSGASLNLTIAYKTTTTLNTLTAAAYGQAVTFTATVSPAPSSGTVQFYDNGVALGSAVSVSGGTASYTTNTLSIGSHPITATYSGVTFYAASSTSSSSTQVINPALLSITANPQSKAYGQTVTFGSGSTNFTSSGLQNGDTIGTVTLAVSSNGGAATAPVSGSPYIITPSAATGGSFNPANYSITYNTGALTVNPALLTVTANNYSRPYGALNPVFTVTYTNFVNGETLGTSDVAGSPALSTGAATNSPVGAYDITNGLGTLTSTNYSFNRVDGTLTVTNAVSSNSVSSSENPALPGDLVTFTATLSTLAPSLAAPYGSVQFQIDGALYGSPVALSNGAASASTATLSHGYHNIEADYGGNSNIIGSTNTLIQLINTPPVAGLATYSRPPNAGLNIAISNLLTNASDADGDALSLVGVSALSTNGAAISTNATTVFYSPPATNGNVTDSFSYTVADIFGATNTGTVVITIQPVNNAPPLTITGIVLLSNGVVQLNFSGTAGSIYLIEAATNLNPPIAWTTLSTNTADTNGVFSFTDTNATNYNDRYYRAATP
jgi:autotransporter-associated beta strand protein